MLPNLPKVLVAGLVLGVIPWIVSGYLFPRRPMRRQFAVRRVLAKPSDSSTAAKAPSLLPASETAHCLQSPSEQQPLILASGCRAEKPLSDGRPIQDQNANDALDNTFAENSVPEPGPVLNSSILADGPAGDDNVSVEPCPQTPYPSTETADGPDMPAGPTLAETPMHVGSTEEDAVPSPPLPRTTDRFPRKR